LIWEWITAAGPKHSSSGCGNMYRILICVPVRYPRGTPWSSSLVRRLQVQGGYSPLLSHGAKVPATMPGLQPGSLTTHVVI
jgi:hypothetical protein